MVMQTCFLLCVRQMELGSVASRMTRKEANRPVTMAFQMVVVFQHRCDSPHNEVFPKFRHAPDRPSLRFILPVLFSIVAPFTAQRVMVRRPCSPTFWP